MYRKYMYNVPKGLPSDSVARVILKALSSQKPNARYVVGPMALTVGVKLKKFIPDTIFFSQIAKRIHG
jgi:hypothetical protein